MIVEALIPDARRASSTRIVINGRPAWTVPADVVARLGLNVGSALRGDLVEQLDRAADEEGAFRSALRSLERRAHGEGELARKLERKGHGPVAVEGAIARLRQLGLLDDLLFARAYVAGRSERGRSPTRLRYDLHRLGVRGDVVEQVLGELRAAVADPLERPRALIARRARQVAALPVEARRRRLTAFLARRGYRGSEARTLVEEALRG